MKESDSGKAYKDNLQEANKYARDLKKELSEIDGISGSTKDKLGGIADSLKGQTSVSAQLTALIQQRNSFIEDSVAKNKSISDIALETMDTNIKLLELKEEQQEIEKNIKDGFGAMKKELLGSLGPAGDLVSTLMKGGPAVAAMAVMAMVVTFIISAVKRSIELNQTMGASAENASRLEANVMAASYSMDGLLYSTDEMRASAMALVETTGRLNIPTQLIADATELGKLLNDPTTGVSLARTLDNAGVDAGKLTDQVKAMGNAYGMDVGPAMEMLRDTQMELNGLTDKEILKIAEKGFLIKKQGIEVSKINEMLSQAVDIEGSMHSAMKLRAMTGVDISFVAMNQAQMDGDGPALAAAMNAEIAKMGPGFEDNFRLQQIMAEGMKTDVATMMNMRNSTEEMTDVTKEQAKEQEAGILAGTMAWAAGLPTWAKVLAAIVAIGAGLIGVTMLFPAIGTGLAAISGSVGTSIAAVGSGIGTAVSSIAAGLGTALAAVGTGIAAVGTGIGTGVAAIGTGIGTALSAIAVGLTAIVAPGTLAIPVLLSLAVVVLALGVALYLASYAIVAIGGLIKEVFDGISKVVTSVGEVMIGIFELLPPIIEAVANGFVTMMGALTPEAILGLMLLGPALLLASVGMVAFAIAMAAASAGSFFGGGIIDDITELAMIGPQLATSATALAAITVNLSEVSTVIESLSTSLSTMASAATPLFQVAAGLASIAGGLGAIATASVFAMPGLGMLVGLAAVAPALKGLGEFFGVGGSNSTESTQSSKSSKSSSPSETNTESSGTAELIKELKGLRQDIQLQPILVSVDGKVVSRISKVQRQQASQQSGNGR
tara:strand:- start:220 stop:2718 length:2499 start_codon:yes stop_codon:yes gene_type:complete